jgi:hypothetical protein
MVNIADHLIIGEPIVQPSPLGKAFYLMVLDYLLCSDFGAQRQNRSTIIEKYRCKTRI